MAAEMSVLVVTAGGLEHGGGIGRMVGYLADEWDRDPAASDYEILDPRGPGPLRLWPGRMLATLWRLQQASPDAAHAAQRPRYRLLPGAGDPRGPASP